MKNKEIFKIARKRLNACRCNSKRRGQVAPNFTWEPVALLLKIVKGCAICEKTLPIQELHVDHCHKTGNLRGLLCTHCNIALGRMGDDIEGVTN